MFILFSFVCLFNFILFLFYFILFYFCLKKKKNKKIGKKTKNQKENMYYLSVLAIFKNETMNLKLWINHYLWQGVEHFYLIDNGSTDEPLRILQEYIDNEIITYYYLPERYKQSEHYRYVFDKERMKEKTIWLAVCDLDEYFYGVDQALVKKIQSLENDYDYILCNWKMFGSDGHITQPDDIRTDITNCAEKLWSETKYIFKPTIIRNSSHIWIHWLTDIHYIRKKRIRYANRLIRLNHYPIQSLEFFEKVKILRGAADNKNSDNVRDLSYFKRFDHKETTDDTLKNIILNKVY